MYKKYGITYQVSIASGGIQVIDLGKLQVGKEWERLLFLLLHGP